MLTSSKVNHNNDGMDVLLGSLGFALIFGIPAGLAVSLLPWGIRTLRLNDDASKPLYKSIDTGFFPTGARISLAQACLFISHS